MKTFFLQVKEVIKETEDAVTLKFWHPISEQIKYKAGQFITIVLPDANGKKVKRSYSMSSSPLTDTAVGVTVKRVAGGFASNYINEQVKAGDFLEVVEPMGNFYAEPTENANRNVFLIAAGSGITPLMSILKTLLKAESNTKVNLLYGNKNENNVIFKAELETIKAQYGHRIDVQYVYSQEGDKERINAAIYTEWLNTQSFNTAADITYMCGPEAMMAEIRQVLDIKQVPHSQVHYERFTAPPSDLHDGINDEGLKTQSVTVKYDGETHVFDVAPHQTILEAALELDIDLPYSCQAGMCTACMGKCVAGKISMDETDGLTEKEIANGFLLTCVCHPLTAGVVLEIE